MKTSIIILLFVSFFNTVGFRRDLRDSKSTDQSRTLLSIQPDQDDLNSSIDFYFSSRSFFPSLYCTGCHRNTSHILNYYFCGASEIRQMVTIAST